MINGFLDRIANALGAAWIGLPLGLLAMLGRAFRRRRSASSAAAAVGPALVDVTSVLLGGCAAATLLWCLLMYGPATTMVHLGSLAVPVLAIAGMGLAAATWRPAAAWGLVARCRRGDYDSGLSDPGRRARSSRDMRDRRRTRRSSASSSST